MSQPHSAESAESNSSYGRSNDESLHLAHPSNPRQLSSGAAYGYGQHSFNTIALPQMSSATTQYPASLYPGQTQSTYPYQSSPAAALGYFPPLNVSVTLPQMPSSHPVPLQIMVQPYVGVGNVPQLNISINLLQMPSAVTHSSFPTWPGPGQLQIPYQPPSEPVLGNVLQSHDQHRLDQIPSRFRLGSPSTSAYPGQTHSTESQSFDAAFGNGQQLYDYSVPVQVPHSGHKQQHTSQRLIGGLVSTSEICTSSSIGSGQSQSTKLPSSRSVPGSSTLSSRLSSTIETHYLSSNDSGPRLSPVYPGQYQSTYQPSSDPAFLGEQMYDHSIPYPALGAGIEHSHVPKELNNDMGFTSEAYPFYPIYSEEIQSIDLSSLTSDYFLESSGFQVSSSALGSVNQGHSFSPNYGSEPFNFLAGPDFEQKASPLDMNSSLKRTVNEIYPSGSELDSSGQSATAPSFEDAPRPRKRLREADIGSTVCVSEERMQSLAATSDHHDLHTPETFPVDDCRVSHDQRMNIPVQQSMTSERRNDTSMFRGAHGFTIRGNPTFTTIGESHVNHNSGPHELQILREFVSFDAIHNSSVQDPDRRCHPGTRANSLSRLQGWIDDPSASERIIWVHGLPGAGKSSIAQTIIRLCGLQKVVATFFFYRSDPGRNDGNRLFTTIAWQLASSIPGVKSHLVNSLTHRPDLPMKDVETQFEELVVQPFHALNDASSHPELPLAPVVVIDGVDECRDENLQRRILNGIDNTLRDRRVPLRFLILSRPEAHIKETVDQFKCTTLCIDLDSIDNANHDIERYFNAEFSRIACERKFDTTWPGHGYIQKLVYNSSGQFVYASTVIKYVGDQFNCAKAQLDVILGLKKCASASPFAPLDELYTEILKRQPDQDFLKDVLALFIACSSIDDGREPHADFPMLLKVSEEEIGRKLRGMQSLLAFEEGYIDIHHRSFLDFLQDVSRSGQYHMSQRASSRRYLELISETIVQYVSVLIDQPQCYDTQHLHLQYQCDYYLQPELDVEDLREVLQPLVNLQDKLLNLPNFTSNRKLPPCNEYDAFETMRNLLLHLALSQAKSHCISSSSRATGPLMVEKEGDYSTFSALPTIEAENNVSEKDLDTDLASLLAYMRHTPSTSPPTVSVLELMYSVLRFDCVEIVKKVSSVLDGQNLVNLINYMIHDQNSFKNGSMNLTCKAIQLVLEIHARIPVLPQSLLYENATKSTWNLDDDNLEIEDLCSKALMARVLNHHFITPHGLMVDKSDNLSLDRGIANTDVNLCSMSLNASAKFKFQVMLELSKSIQYLHSCGTVLSCATGLIGIYLDPEFRPKLPIWCLDIKCTKNKYEYESNVFTFGRLFYQMYFNVKLSFSDCIELKRDTIVKRPSKPEIREDAWQLIQRCCAEDPESRPTIDGVVQEMESWGIESEITTPASPSPSSSSDF